MSPDVPLMEVVNAVVLTTNYRMEFGYEKYQSELKF